MKTLILVSLLLFMGCGSKKDSNETSSSAATVTTPTVLLKKGQSKDEVASILGNPDSIENVSGLKETWWLYTTESICASEGQIPCYAIFDEETALLTRIRGLQTKFVDINSF